MLTFEQGKQAIEKHVKSLISNNSVYVNFTKCKNIVIAHDDKSTCDLALNKLTSNGLKVIVDCSDEDETCYKLSISQ